MVKVGPAAAHVGTVRVNNVPAVIGPPLIVHEGAALVVWHVPAEL